MSDRFFTQENVLDLVRTVFPMRVLVNDKGEHICQMQFLIPGEKGFQTLSSKLDSKDERSKEYDHYDGMYMLMFQAAQVIKNGLGNVDGMVVAREEDDPIKMLREMTE